LKASTPVAAPSGWRLWQMIAVGLTISFVSFWIGYFVRG
jgi:hypothetical protein